MNAQFHTPSYGDQVFDLRDVGANTSTPNSSMATGNMINNNNSYQQQTPQSAVQTKRMISLHNTSDEYHTANEESFTTNNLMNNSAIPSNTNNGQTGTQSNSTMTTPTTTMAARKQMLPADLTEPSKPLSAYALFFRDTVSAIKQQNPTCSFQELSKIVASMWDALDPTHKSVYNKKNELARNEYIQKMKIYRQQLEQQQQIQEENSNNDTNPTEAPNTLQQRTPEELQKYQQNTQTVSYTSTSATTAPTDDHLPLLNEAGLVQKCTRENCNKRAIINPDWEDEYCSNECVIIHCRNVFNAWVQSNLEAKQQQQQSTTT